MSAQKDLADRMHGYHISVDAEEFLKHYDDKIKKKLNDKILEKIKIGSRCLVRDVRNYEWNVWCEAKVMKRIETSKSRSIEVVYTDPQGDIQKVTSCLIGGIVKAHDSDIVHALSLMQ